MVVSLYPEQARFKHNKKSFQNCSTRIRTGVTRFRVWGDNHYTIPHVVPRENHVMYTDRKQLNIMYAVKHLCLTS